MVGKVAIALSALLLALAFESRELLGQPIAQALRLEAKIPLGNVAGRIDHMAIDLPRKRLFIAELGNNSVGVVDLDSRKVVHRLTGLKEPQGVAYVQATDTLYVANRGDGSVRIFRGADYTPAGRVELHSDADNIRFDRSANHIIVGYGNGGLAVIDAATNTSIGSMTLKAHPESFQLDPTTSDVFVNLPDERALTVMDRITGQERNSWAMPHAGNFAMALDNERARVLTVFRDPAKLVAVSKQTGKVESEVNTCGDVDDLFFDAKRQRVYISCGEGFIDVRDAGNPAYPRLSRIATVSGARTSFFVPEMDRLLLAVRAQAGQPAAIWIYSAVSESATSK
jgi:DNA-binding beta-propeller fold protein YncE